MIYYIKGTLVIKEETFVVVETGGIGYKVFVPAVSGIYASDIGEEVILYTTMIVREDDVSLYGFDDKQTLDMFNLLITVSGVGAKAAMSILSALSLRNLLQAIAFEDAAALAVAQGVGKKTAQRVCLELGEKVSKMMDVSGTAVSADGKVGTAASSGFAGDDRSEAVNALMALGYSRSEAMNALAGVSGEGLTTEDYIKQALKKLF